VIKNPSYYSPLIETLRPIRNHLLAPLASIFRNTGRSETERNFATTLLADHAADQPDFLAQLLMDADPKAFATLFPAVERHAERTLPVFQAEIAGRADPARDDSPEETKDRLAERQARAAAALVRLGHADDVWPLLRHSPDPRLRSFIANWLNPFGVDPRAIAAELARLDSSLRSAERGEGGRKPRGGSSMNVMDAILFHPETSIRRALILALARVYRVSFETTFSATT
jgi:hypothetical protein